MTQRVAVPGAGGHTGGFVVAELRRRGLEPVPCPRGTDLDEAFRQVDAVINCAGPFAATAGPAIGAAVRAGLPYLDVTAEIEVVTETFAGHRDAPIPIVPAAAFFGGLADLLATTVFTPGTEKILIGYALSSWHPTPGTRATGRVSAQRRAGRRIAYRDGGLRVLGSGDAPRTEWTFPSGTRPVVGEFTTADSATIPTHLAVREVATFMTVNAVDDLIAGRAREHDESFLVEVVAGERRAVARGRDIYAITAPLCVEAAVRILAGEGAAPGVASLGARFDARDFLDAMPLE
ncbi:saccharopine dehydrogenase family protein [Catenuloplanes japonicus]|uniref:hypothetical protein n=1 Tax=Catenuloplanes japonicus TaxID=33876 RepID=UPI0005250E49|nr:hypothetical protein [Catenuloplanes japonicus]